MARTIERYRQIVQQLLNKYAQIPYAHDDLIDETIFDRQADRYLLVTVGWQGRKRIHTTILHLDIRENQVWVQCNNTDQDIVAELIERGITQEDIVVPVPVTPESESHLVADRLATV
jgi:hypothetical protein